MKKLGDKKQSAGWRRGLAHGLSAVTIGLAILAANAYPAPGGAKNVIVTTLTISGTPITLYKDDSSPLPTEISTPNGSYTVEPSNLIPLTTTSPGGATERSAITFGNTLPTYIAGLYNWSIGAGVALAVIILMYAGYLMITSAGDPQKVGFAKEIIVGALAGLALLAGARLILNVLSVTS